MGTRCDSVDPGAILYLQDTYNMDTTRMRDFIYNECGLLGVSGVSNDMRELFASDKPEAKLAIDLFVHRVGIMAGQLAAELQGIDGFVFTAGIGENSPPIREMVGEKLKWLGVEIDKEVNYKCYGVATKISAPTSKIPVWVIPTNEELMIARHTAAFL